MSTSYSDRVNAPIDCPLKMSTIAWTRCIEYRQEYKCLCKEARDRLRTKGEGKEAFEEKLRQIRRPMPAKPKGWKVDRMSRFYVIYDEKGELRHRATNQAEADDYLSLAAQVVSLADENARLWKLLEEDLTRAEDPWAETEWEMSAITVQMTPILDKKTQVVTGLGMFVSLKLCRNS